MNADPESTLPESSTSESTTAREPAAEETAQSELDLGVISTGSAQVDAALQPLESLGERAVSEHVEVFEHVLADLSQAMSADGADEPQD